MHDHQYRELRLVLTIGFLFLVGGGVHAEHVLPVDTVAEPILVPAPLRVDNRMPVTVRVTKYPIATCEISTKRTALAEETNPLASLLAVARLALVSGLAGQNEPTAPDVSSLSAYHQTLLRRFQDAFSDARARLGETEETLKEREAARVTMAKATTAFLSAKTADSTKFDADKKKLVADLAEFVALGMPPWGLVSVELEALGERWNELPTIGDVANQSPYEAWRKVYGAAFDALLGAGVSAKNNHDALTKSFSEAEALHKALEAFSASTTYSKKLPLERNARLDGTVKCKNAFTKTAMSELPFSVTFQSDPRASISLGLIVSPIGKKQITTEFVKTGVDDMTGETLVGRRIGLKAESGTQVIPFTFFNIGLTSGRGGILTGTFGVGLNPYNGGTDVEFFAGPTLKFNDLMLHAGVHWGREQRLENGFAIGDIPPAGLSTLPIEKPFVTKLSFGISYRLPLPAVK